MPQVPICWSQVQSRLAYKLLLMGLITHLIIISIKGVRFTRNGSPTTSPNGYLQVYDSSTKRWGPVCGGSVWGSRQRTDACEQAGFGPTYPVSNQFFARKIASGPQTSARCLSSTNKQIDCNQGVQWGASTCAKSTDNLYISCQKCTKYLKHDNNSIIINCLSFVSNPSCWSQSI